MENKVIKLELEHKDSLLDDKKEELDKRELDLNTKETELAKKERDLESQQRAIEQGLPEQAKNHYAVQKTELDGYAKQLDIKGSKQTESLKELNKQQQKLNDEQKEFASKQEVADSDFSRQRSQLEKELAEEKINGLSQLNEELATEKEIERKKIYSSLEQVKTDLDSEAEQLSKDQAKLKTDVEKLRFDEQVLKNNQVNIAIEVDEQVIDRKLSFEQMENTQREENQRLRGYLKRSDEALSLHEDLKKHLGGEEPAAVLQRLSSQQEELARLNEELLNRPSREIQERYDAMDSKVKDLENSKEQLDQENREYQKQEDKVDKLNFNINKLESKNKSLESRYAAVSADNNKLQEELKRLNPAYEEKETREKRIQGITREVITKRVERLNGNVNELSVLEVNEDRNFTELEWLESIRQNTENYGLSFSKRILFAFHTALKIAEWSPITVLAGVSGTGKSELPRLYAHFGGINFMNVPVQPNWDSQESLLGYYNSIDNCFEAQPILNFLAQSQESKSDGYNGLKDTINLVLLDEMNLAHVELYFADFLSKLEQRRGVTGKENMPDIKVKLGANIEPFSLTLGRNIRFVGTMNQDETTKSLSDKVLDRGVSIYFPRPTILKERKKLIPLGEPLNLIPKKLWKGWTLSNSDLSLEETKKYKGIIEDINTHLGNVGKALGHRVWQSIEYYMVNHPLVKALPNESDEYKKALHFSFEDQLVQKVMPKLRGIETRGIGKTDCLDKIHDLLINKKLNLVKDFNRARLSGYGQFMWCSADYLNDDQANKDYELLWEQAYTIKGETATKPLITPEEFKQLQKCAYELGKDNVSYLTIKEIKDTLSIEPKIADEIKKYLNESAKG